MERALPGMQKSLETHRALTVDDYLGLAKTAYFSYATVPVSNYSEATTLDVIIGLERDVLDLPRIHDDSAAKEAISARKMAVKRPTPVASRIPAAKIIPKPVRNFRTAVALLVKDHQICFVDPKASWQSIKIYFGPFEVAVRTDAESGTLELVSTIGQVSTTAGLEELFSELPIGPVEFSYELEVNPTILHHGRMPLESAADAAYLLRFIKQHVLSTLVMAVTLIASDLLVSPSQQVLNAFELNKGQKYFYDVLSYEELLQRNPS